MTKKIKQEIIDRLKGKKTEPSANLKTMVDLIKALNQYRLSYERDDARKWIIDYCKQHNLQSVLSERLPHSVKPEWFYELVNRCSFDNKLELFARKEREGYDCFGNQVTNSVNLELYRSHYA